MSKTSDELRTHQIELEMQNDELRLAEQALTEAHDRFADLYDFAPVGYVTVGDKGLIMQANLTLAGMLGVDRSMLPGQPLMRFIAQEDNNHWYLLMLSMLKHDRRESLELVLKRADGGCIHVQFDCLPVSKDGEAAVRIAITDICARKAVEATLERYVAQSRALFENMIDIYYKADMDGRLEVISPSCLAQTGYRQEEVVGRLMVEFYADPARRDALLRELDDKGVVNDFEVELIHKDGLPRCTSVTAHILADKDGRPSGMEGILRNISVRKWAENARDTLLQENRLLVRQLMQVQEEERRMLARDLHDEMGQLLTSIDVRAEYIAKHADDAGIRAIAEEIKRDTSASFDAGHAMLLRLRPAALDTLGLAAALTELIGSWQKQAGMKCSLRIDGEIDALDEMHAIAIYRLVQEGLTNARRHGKADCVEVIVRCVLLHAGRPAQVQVEISDNGKGLHVETVSKGMGIIGMRERVHALGGTFSLTHVPMDGVRIEAVLPVADDRKESQP